MRKEDEAFNSFNSRPEIKLALAQKADLASDPVILDIWLRIAFDAGFKEGEIATLRSLIKPK